MRYFILLVSIVVIGLVAYLEMNNVQKILNITGGKDNPNNINIQLENNQKKIDSYNDQIDTIQNQTNDALKNINQ